MLGSGRETREVPVDWREWIEINPAILVGKPIVKGTRLAIDFLLDLIAAGCPEDEILRNYPGLTHTHLLACVAYAAEIVRTERVYPLAS
jgi:uncharacterized protein (DUF433 family)